MIDLDEIERIANAGDAYGHVTTCATVLALIAEVRALRERLEIDPRHGIDGIDARDETIRLQDGEIAKLRRAIQRQANAARTLADATIRDASIRQELAEKAYAESSPEVLASERQANAMLTAENDALREDAERYRWLRSDDIEVLPGQHEIFVIKQRMPFTDDPDELLIGSDLDAAIDEARGAK